MSEEPEPEDDDESHDEVDLADSMLSTPVKQPKRKSKVKKQDKNISLLSE